MARVRRIRRVRLVILQRQQFLPVDRHVTRCLDPQADLASIDVHDGDADVVTDVDLLTQFATQDQHLATLLRAKQWWLAIVLYPTSSAPAGRRHPIFHPILVRTGGTDGPRN